MEKETLYDFLQKNYVSMEYCPLALQVLEDLGLLKGLEKIEPFNNGMTNQLFKLTTDKGLYLLRFSGAGTEKIISRKNESNVYKAISGKGISEEVIYISPETGIKVSQFIDKAHVCDPYNKEEVESCIEFLKRFHNMKLEVEHEFDVFEKINLYEEQCTVRKEVFPDFETVRFNVMKLKNLLKDRKKFYRLCHIDPVYDNFLIQNGKVFLIDWEYAGNCDPLIDIAMFALYTDYSKKEVDRLIEAYLGKEGTEEEYMVIYAYISLCGYLWVLWCEIKHMNGKDYDEYEKRQYQFAKDYYEYAINLYEKEN